ncbi:SGS domain protein [Necator americanus]|uniref:SGS domain protein n=1 Tax=Necator americanus TaxID=51031 RepID=W2T6Z9_NECAM|nr:SGS domain protein [Necator americanus]ETN77663.1 SGS domain protein [Necator americanus]
MGDHYGFSLTTFSPSGKLMQIEYALNAVKNGQPSVGLRAKDGVVLSTENIASVLFEDQPKIEKISQHIGCVYSGMGPDFRILVKRARKIAMEYELMYGEEIPTTQLVTQIAAVMQEYTQSGGVRPFGVSLLIAGWDKTPGRPLLFQSDPSGAYFAWKATALGKNDVNAKTFLEKRYSEALELDDGIHTALLTLRESFDVGMTEDNVEHEQLCMKSLVRSIISFQVLIVLNHFEADLPEVTTSFSKLLCPCEVRNGHETEFSCRFDWFQTDTSVTVTILKKGVALNDCRVTFLDNDIKVYCGDEIIFETTLARPVDEKNFTVTCTPSKVEIRMPKASAGHWPVLGAPSAIPATTELHHPSKNWEAIERKAVEEEENEQLEGDAAVNRMFRKLYNEASDDVKKAMIKSYQESGGTVLSTNWAEISKKRTEVRPPDCMEYKHFEQTVHLVFFFVYHRRASIDFTRVCVEAIA